MKHETNIEIAAIAGNPLQEVQAAEARKAAEEALAKQRSARSALGWITRRANALRLWQQERQRQAQAHTTARREQCDCTAPRSHFVTGG